MIFAALRQPRRGAAAITIFGTAMGCAGPSNLAHPPAQTIVPTVATATDRAATPPTTTQATELVAPPAPVVGEHGTVTGLGTSKCDPTAEDRQEFDALKALEHGETYCEQSLSSTTAMLKNKPIKPSPNYRRACEARSHEFQHCMVPSYYLCRNDHCEKVLSGTEMRRFVEAIRPRRQ